MTPMAPSRRRPPTKTAAKAASDETKQRIVDATLETLKAEGFLGTTARNIARRGEFNQALIFYHFGSVDDLLLASVDSMAGKRLAVYRDRVAEASSLPDLVEIAKELIGADLRDGYMTVLAQLLSGAHARPELAEPLRQRFQPWIDVVEESVLKIVEGTAFAHVVPTRELATTITAMFMGIELMTQLDPEHSEIESLFGTIDLLAALLQVVLSVPAPAAS